jgi:hypothetical protein
MLHPREIIEPLIPAHYAGEWVALDRDRTRIIASGRTFDEAKHAASAAGEQSVVIGKVSPPTGRSRIGRRLIYMVTVFISLAQNPAMPSNSFASDLDDDTVSQTDDEKPGRRPLAGSDAPADGL